MKRAEAATLKRFRKNIFLYRDQAGNVTRSIAARARAPKCLSCVRPTTTRTQIVCCIFCVGMDANVDVAEIVKEELLMLGFEVLRAIFTHMDTKHS